MAVSVRRLADFPAYVFYSMYVPVIGIFSFLLWYRCAAPRLLALLQLFADVRGRLNECSQASLYVNLRHSYVDTSTLTPPACADNGYMKEQAFFYYMYYIFVLFHCAFTIYMAIGIPSTGAAGLINCISSFANGHSTSSANHIACCALTLALGPAVVAGVFCVLGTVGWALEALASLFMFRIVYRHANGDKGYTFAQAQEEIKIHGLKAYLLRGSRV